MMVRRRVIGAGLLCLGVALIAAGWLQSGREDARLIRDDLPLDTHVTALTPAAGGTILAATQAGELWRFDRGVWNPDDAGIGGRLVLALRGEPGRVPIGTATGLIGPPEVPPLPGNPRVSDLLQTSAGLLVATSDGLRLEVEGHWRILPVDAPVYRLAEQHRAGRTSLHAGTIGQGVYSAAAEAASSWTSNSRGLPDGVKVLAFAVTEGGRLIAGTDQGLYTQAAPGEIWTALGEGAGGRRVLSLYRAPSDPRGIQRLWIGSDAGLAALDLAETDDRLTARGPPRDFGALWEPPETGVSWIVPTAEGGVMISAGGVYRLRPVRGSDWYGFALVGILSVFVGAGLLLGSRGR